MAQRAAALPRCRRQNIGAVFYAFGIEVPDSEVYLSTHW